MVPGWFKFSYMMHYYKSFIAKYTQKLKKLPWHSTWLWGESALDSRRQLKGLYFRFLELFESN